MAVALRRGAQPDFCREIAAALDVIAVVTIARGGGRQQDHASRRCHPPREEDSVLHRRRLIYCACQIGLPARYGARQGTNPPPAVAEADNGLGGTSQDRFDEPA